MDTETVVVATGETKRQNKGRVRGVYERKPGEWWIRYTSQGVYHREKAGTYGTALKLYSKRKQKGLEDGKLPELRKRTATFTELADAAIQYVKGKYARPADDAARLELMKGWFTARSADGIKPGEIEAKLERATEENGWSPSTRNHYHNLLCLCYRLALRDDKVESSPVHGKVRKVAENNARVRFLLPEEEKKLRTAIRSKPEWAEHEPEFDLALHSGLRRGSMYLDLVWENVDLAGRTFTVPRTKNGEPITLPLNDDAMRALRIFRSRGNGKGRVVRNLAGETLNVNAHWFVPAVRAAGIKDFRWHDLRHSYASRLRQAGVPLGNIAELLGHKGLAMTRRYAHLSISNLHEAVSRISTGTTIAPEPIVETRAQGFVN
jgi:integrase